MKATQDVTRDVTPWWKCVDHPGWPSPPRGGGPTTSPAGHRPGSPYHFAVTTTPALAPPRLGPGKSHHLDTCSEDCHAAPSLAPSRPRTTTLVGSPGDNPATAMGVRRFCMDGWHCRERVRGERRCRRGCRPLPVGAWEPAGRWPFGGRWPLGTATCSFPEELCRLARRCSRNLLSYSRSGLAAVRFGIVISPSPDVGPMPYPLLRSSPTRASSGSTKHRSRVLGAFAIRAPRSLLPH